MDTSRVIFLRQYLITNVTSQAIVTMEFSYDTGVDRPPRFFGVPDQDLARACALYVAWGGIRGEGERRGTTARRPIQERS